MTQSGLVSRHRPATVALASRIGSSPFAARVSARTTWPRPCPSGATNVLSASAATHDGEAVLHRQVLHGLHVRWPKRSSLSKLTDMCHSPAVLRGIWQNFLQLSALRRPWFPVRTNGYPGSRRFPLAILCWSSSFSPPDLSASEWQIRQIVV